MSRRASGERSPVRHRRDGLDNVGWPISASSRMLLRIPKQVQLRTFLRRGVGTPDTWMLQVVVSRSKPPSLPLTVIAQARDALEGWLKQHGLEEDVAAPGPEHSPPGLPVTVAGQLEISAATRRSSSLPHLRWTPLQEWVYLGPLDAQHLYRALDAWVMCNGGPAPPLRGAREAEERAREVATLRSVLQEYTAEELAAGLGVLAEQLVARHPDIAGSLARALGRAARRVPSSADARALAAVVSALEVEAQVALVGKGGGPNAKPG